MRRFATGALRASQALGIIALAWVVLYLPFWEGIRTLKPLVSGPSNRFFLHSLAASASGNSPTILAGILDFNDVESRNAFMGSVRRFLDNNLRLWGYGVLALVAIAVTWRARTFNRMLTAWGWVSIAAIMTQGWFWPWYVSWAVVPAALAPSRRLRIFTLIFTISALFHYIEEQILSYHWAFFWDWSGLLIMGPPLLYLLFAWLIEKKHKQWHSASRSDIN